MKNVVKCFIFLFALILTGCEENDNVGPAISIENNDLVIYMQSDSKEKWQSGIAPGASESSGEENTYEYIYDDVNKVYSKEAASGNQTVLAFAGDICFHEGYANMSTLHSATNGIYDCIKPEVMEQLIAADIFMVNNEFPYTANGTPIPEKQYTFKAKPESVSILGQMGVDVVSLANNHAYDQGEEGLLDTIDVLNNAKIPFVGAGRNLEEACKPVYFKVNGITIAYVSATQIERLANPDTKEATSTSAGVLRTLDATRFVSVIEAAEANSDFVVVYVHWGSESTDIVEQSQRDLARKYVEAGADLIIGDHSHCLQGIDYIDSVPVFYSLGNFWFNSKTVDTGFVTATVNSDAKLETLKFVPCVQEGCRTRLAVGDKHKSILDYLQGISNHIDIDEDGFLTESI